MIQSSRLSRTNIAQLLVTTAILALLDLVPAAVEQQKQGQRHPNRERGNGHSREDPGGLADSALAANAVVDGEKRGGLTVGLELE